MPDLKLADAEAQALSEAVLRVATNRLKLADMAVSAFVQNVVTQATVQALVNLFKTKSLISAAELDRALAKAYQDARAEAEARGLIAVPTAHAVRGN